MGETRAAMIDEQTGQVVDLIVLPHTDPDPVPVFVDGAQLFEDVQVGVDDDGTPIMQPQPVMRPGEPVTAPDRYVLEALPDDSPVGPGWSLIDGTWVAPVQPTAPVEGASSTGATVDRLIAVLRAAGVLDDAQLAELLEQQ